MKDIQDKFLQNLNEEAARWVEEEFQKRMAHAKKAIQEQTHISMPEIGPTRAGNHLKKALAYAEEEIRMELEFEAQNWIDARVRDRRDALKKKT